jgi:hypothetical protein
MSINDLISLYYDPQNNYMINNDGCIVYDIFNFMHPRELVVFQSNKKDMVINASGKLIELIYPNKHDIDLCSDWRFEHHRDRVKYRTQK